MESNYCAVKNLNYDEVFKQESSILASESDKEFEFRLLKRDDFNRGYMELLSQLTVVGNVSQTDFEQRFDSLFPHRADTYRMVVVVDKEIDKIVACGTIFIEKKFLRQTGIV